MPKRPFGDALRDATDGVVRTFREQTNFRIQVLIGAVAIALAALARFASWRWTVLLLTIGIVLGAELFNTALERAVDLASPEHQAPAQAAKHAAAGAVLMVSLAAVAVGLWLFGGALLHI
jgi:diacylglycerol kinase